MSKRACLNLVFVALLAATGCEENLDPATPDGALHRLRNAVVKKDAPAILDACSNQTRTLLKELHEALATQATTITAKYPDAHRVAARASYPPGTLDAKTPEALFAALLAGGLDLLDPSAGLAYGLTAQGRPSLDGDHASVTSQAGEAYEFVLEGGAWKSTVFEREIAAHINHAKLHQQTMDENLKVVAELARLEQLKQAREAPASTPPSAPAAP
ncbi:hypothetical protein L6V77_01375 [Myxococcota bacterium]|jgi:hypothetical protein|nr:hypothetical protein [Myxococcota bacterium]